MKIFAALVFLSLTVRASADPGVKVWLTTSDGHQLLARQPDLGFDAKVKDAAQTITVDVHTRYQEMDGFGASLTDSSAFLLQKRLDGPTRQRLLQEIFGRNGIRLSLLRQPMGACDYSLNLFTYDEHPGDAELKQFSIEHDRHFILPALKEALAINPSIKVFATPWSPPSWMKTGNSMLGGHLRPDCYRVYAEYFARFLQAYRAEGITVFALSMQNEPLFEPLHYPSTAMPANEEAAFLKVLGPTLQDRKLETKLIIYDHNWDRPDYPLSILGDPEAAKYVAGVAWHGYGGQHSAMSEVHDAHPEKGAWFTESSGGDWVPAFHDAFMDEMRHVIRAPRNWSRSVVWWNLALDSEHGPSLLGDASTCRGLVTIDPAGGKYEFTVDYYTMGHISKFVEPGACRIASNTFPDELEDVAFENPDGTKVLIVSNRSHQARMFGCRQGEKHFSYRLPAEAAATFVW